jgi:hypothetical protein
MNTNAERLMEIFARAKELRSPAEREGYLAEACAGDAALRQEVDSLLAANSAAGEFLLHPAAVAGAAQQTVLMPPLSEQAGARIGRYKLLEQIGEGGFGVVWMAEQEEPARRRVALKVIKLGGHDESVVPSGLTNVVTIAAFYFHSLAVKEDGTIVAWGWNDWGQNEVPEGVNNVVAIATDHGNRLAVIGDGRRVRRPVFPPERPTPGRKLDSAWQKN